MSFFTAIYLLDCKQSDGREQAIMTATNVHIRRNNYSIFYYGVTNVMYYYYYIKLMEGRYIVA